MRYLLLLLIFVFPVHAQECGPDSFIEKGSYDIWWGGGQNLNKFVTMRQCEQGYDSCLLTNYQLWQALFPPPDPIDCKTTSDFTDGPGGNLWKPASDHKPTPVFLLPGEYESVRGVEVFEKATGQKVADGSFRTCCPNGGRSHYDIHELASNLDVFNPIIIRMSNGDCFEVPVASQRWD